MLGRLRDSCATSVARCHDWMRMTSTSDRRACRRAAGSRGAGPHRLFRAKTFATGRIATDGHVVVSVRSRHGERSMSGADGRAMSLSSGATGRCFAARVGLRRRLSEQRGLHWFEYSSMFYRERLRTPLSIAFAFVATHNHFVLDRDGKVFNRTAPVIKLALGATEDDHLALLGLLNSSVACFWMKQVFQPKGATQRQRHHPDPERARVTSSTTTGLKQFPFPIGRVAPIDRLAQRARWTLRTIGERRLGAVLSTTLARSASRTLTRCDERSQSAWREPSLREADGGAQEELDWLAYAPLRARRGRR